MWKSVKTNNAAQNIATVKRKVCMVYMVIPVIFRHNFESWAILQSLPESSSSLLKKCFRFFNIIYFKIIWFDPKKLSFESYYGQAHSYDWHSILILTLNYT